MSFSCFSCAKPGATKRCSVCKEARYCNAECQTNHWQKHKLDCKPLPAADERPTPSILQPGGLVDAALLAKERGPRVEALALQPPTNLIAPWKFLADHIMFVPGRMEYTLLLGRLLYALPMYEFSCAVGICGWIFVLERIKFEVRHKINPYALPDTWYICAFFESKHYNFGTIKECPNLEDKLLAFVHSKITPIFYPDLVKAAEPDANGVRTMQWCIRSL